MTPFVVFFHLLYVEVLQRVSKLHLNESIFEVSLIQTQDVFLDQFSQPLRQALQLSLAKLFFAGPSLLELHIQVLDLATELECHFFRLQVLLDEWDVILGREINVGYLLLSENA